MNEAEFQKRLEEEGYEGPFDYVKGPDFVDQQQRDFDYEFEHVLELVDDWHG